MQSNRDKNKGKKPEPKGQQSPFSNIALWVIILMLVPMVMFLYNQKNESSDQLKQYQLEQALRERRVTSLVVRDDSSGVMRVTGTYEPEADQEERNFTANVLDAREHWMEFVRANMQDGYDAEAATGFWRSFLLPLIPIVLLILVIYFIFTRQIRNAGKGAIQFGKSRAKMVQSHDRVTFSDVAGVKEAKEEVVEIIEYLKDPDRFHRLGGQMPKGVLMVGPPGTGKTLLAKAIAGEADVPFFNISGSDFVEMFVGVGASRVRDMFEQGKKHAPCIIFIDEIDAVGRSRFSGMGGGHDEREQTLNALLVEMDGFEGKSGVIVVAATNRPDVLDPALLRPGRFDRQISIDLPDLNGRLEILQVHIKKVKVSDNVDLAITARGTPGFSGADLANLINEAALLAAREGKNSVEQSDMEEARDKVRWGKERRSRVMDENDKRVTAYHEAGHALVGLHCEHSMPLHKVTIIPRGNAFLGAAMYLPERDKYNHSRSELLDELAKAMGGRVAEEMIFDEITSGAAMDIKQSTHIARKMVCEWGMSEKMGPLAYGEREDQIYLAREMTRRQDYSEKTAGELDDEIKAVVDGSYQRARRILTEHRDQLELLGSTLLVKETMDVKEIRELIGLPDPRDKQEAKASDVIDTTMPTPEPADTAEAPLRTPLEPDLQHVDEEQVKANAPTDQAEPSDQAEQPETDDDQPDDDQPDADENDDDQPDAAERDKPTP